MTALLTAGTYVVAYELCIAVKVDAREVRGHSRKWSGWQTSAEWEGADLVAGKTEILLDGIVRKETNVL